MKPLLLALLLGTVFTACSKRSNFDKVPGPVQALIDSATCVCEPYVRQYLWRDQTIYLWGYTGPTCNWIPGYFDAEGKPVVMAENYNLYEFLEEASYVKLIWECRK